MIIKEINQLKHELSTKRAQKRIVFVPTMGNLHDGHLHLVRLAQQHGDYVIVSIFVNPLQFGPNEDFGNYPRSLQQDIAQLAKLNVDIIFTPHVSDIYPAGLATQTQVSVPAISNELCGFFRPGFFTGIATVVCKLFNIVRPQVAIFGEKDFQQLLIIRKLVADLCIEIEIIAAPTVRESDGLAMSSRNQYLLPEERTIAPLLYRSLKWTADNLVNGKLNFSQLEEIAKTDLVANFKVDYFSIRNRHNLMLPNHQDKELIILVAAWLGKARLIDNILVNL